MTTSHQVNGVVPGDGSELSMQQFSQQMAESDKAMRRTEYSLNLENARGFSGQTPFKKNAV
jgi:hypothetical protein